MDHTGKAAEHDDRAFWPWFRFWIELAILFVLAVIGAFLAAAAVIPGDYESGMILILAAIVLGFLRIKYRFDGGTADWIAFALVDRMADLAVMLPLLTIIAFVGLLIAHAWQFGIIHQAGLALFVVSLVLGFLNIKHVFDRIDSGTR